MKLTVQTEWFWYLPPLLGWFYKRRPEKTLLAIDILWFSVSFIYS